MEYFTWLILNLIEVNPRFNYGLCQQIDSYLLIEERLYSSDSELWKNCLDYKPCEMVQYQYYYARSQCETIDSYGDPIESYDEPEEEFEE